LVTTASRRALLAATANGMLLTLWGCAAGYVQPLALVLAATHAGLEAWAQSSDDGPVDRGDAVSFVSSGLALLVVYGSAISASQDVSGLVVALWVLGIGLRVGAMVDLGREFRSSTRSGLADPVRTGLYRWCAHPSEVGFLSCVWVPTLHVGTAPAVVAAIIGSIGAAWRVRQENRDMSGRLALRCREPRRASARRASS